MDFFYYNYILQLGEKLQLKKFHCVKIESDLYL
jgi:hypothetical protein